MHLRLNLFVSDLLKGTLLSCSNNPSHTKLHDSISHSSKTTQIVSKNETNNCRTLRPQTPLVTERTFRETSKRKVPYFAAQLPKVSAPRMHSHLGKLSRRQPRKCQPTSNAELSSSPLRFPIPPNTSHSRNNALRNMSKANVIMRLMLTARGSALPSSSCPEDRHDAKTASYHHCQHTRLLTVFVG
ncbi:uncharacterized protein LY89DRAFT_498742 [Mollisia scopiformis]|uniref:Uncharacterized protein n=1 Tax=Mollisia scopiformis TaxID=149040 RepID=A0A194XEC9_MOLSC|nr:uncharacterized protein LY89DRAFT_498742 [Mollisia scopiformis]KUJ18533.1 hypothetical protein LY89DRAFT_498742 [Mollisia scopiformis]